MDFFNNLLTNVSKGLNSAVGIIANPIQSVAGLAQGIVRNAPGAPFLQGASTNTLQSGANIASSKVTVQGTSPLTRIGSTIQGALSQVIQGGTNILTSLPTTVGVGIGNKAAQVVMSKSTTSTSNPGTITPGDVVNRLVNTGLNAIDSFVGDLLNRGNQSNPRPMEISTGRGMVPSVLDNPVLAQSPALPAINVYPQNTGNANTVGADAPNSFENSPPQNSGGFNMNLVWLGVAGVGAYLLLRRKR